MSFCHSIYNLESTRITKRSICQKMNSYESRPFRNPFNCSGNKKDEKSLVDLQSTLEQKELGSEPSLTEGNQIEGALICPSAPRESSVIDTEEMVNLETKYDLLQKSTNRKAMDAYKALTSHFDSSSSFSELEIHPEFPTIAICSPPQHDNLSTNLSAKLRNK